MRVILIALIMLVACETPSEVTGVEPVIDTEPLLAPEVRSDIAQAIGEVVCTSKSHSFSKNVAIEDAQVYVEKVKVAAKDGPEANEAFKKYAAKLAVERGDLGFGFHPCGNSEGSVFTTRAPWPFEHARQNFKESMGEHCRDVRIGFATDELVYPWLGQLLPRDLQQRQGYLSIECYPKFAETTGPKLWYLVNFNSNAEPPMLSQANTSLLSWMNALRRKLDLPKLKKIEILSKEKKEKLFDEGLTHNRSLLQSLRDSLQNVRYKLKGEIRVVAHDPFGAASLLWKSAPHRSFFMDKSIEFVEYISKGDLHVFLGFSKSADIQNKE